jgi:hypothetical protein
MLRFFHTFKRADELLSRPGGLKYTKKQLFYEVCRLLEPKWRKKVAALLPISLSPRLGYGDFDDLLKSFFRAGGNLANLLPEDMHSYIRDESDEPDLFDYGLPRLIVCRNDATATMLINNWVHLEFSCLILPKSRVRPLPDCVCAVLARAEEPTVYLLLNTAEEDYDFFNSFSLKAAAPRKSRIERIGLTPRQALERGLYTFKHDNGRERAWRLRYRLNRKSLKPNPDLATWEKDWLKSGYYADLEQLAPRQIISLIRKSINFNHD